MEEKVLLGLVDLCCVGDWLDLSFDVLLFQRAHLWTFVMVGFQCELDDFIIWRGGRLLLRF